MSGPLAGALSRVVDAELPHATERVATRLLTLAEWTPSGHGHIVLSWEEFGALCNRANRNAARRHLTALAKAGLIHYSSGEQIYITWLHPERASAAGAPQEDVPRAAHDAPARPEQRGHAPYDPADPDHLAGLPRAVDSAHSHHSARPRAADGAPPRHPPHTRANGGGGGDIYPQPDPENTTTNHSAETVELLHELGLQPETIRIHTALSPEQIERIVDDWALEAEDRSQAKPPGIGALIYRLRNGITPVDPDAVDRRARAAKYRDYEDVIIS